jgi:ribose-phosphate pyrophosphokinase
VGIANVYVPYLPYARQDKAVENDSTFALHTFLKMLPYTYMDDWHFLDPHPAEIPFAYYERYQPPFDAMVNNYDCVIFPDKGANARYDIKHPNIVTAEKVRDQATGHITHFDLPPLNMPSKGSVLVVDDLCDGGATFHILAKDIRKQVPFADSVTLYVTHGVFSRGVKDLLEDYTMIITTDSFDRTYGSVEMLAVAAAQSPKYKAIEQAIANRRLAVYSSLALMLY